MIPDFALLLLALIIILASAELFTNGIEWLGHKLDLSEGVVGSVLAAVGTALPETLIPIVAVAFFGGKHGHEIGIGAIAGAPFMLTTLTLGLFGLAVWSFSRQNLRGKEIAISKAVICRDLRFFLFSYGIAIAFAYMPAIASYRYVVALLLLAIYGLYIYQTFAHEGETGHAPEILHFERLLNDKSKKMKVIISQVGVGLAGIIGGASLFVDHVAPIAHGLGIPPIVLSLIIAPVATELPEKVNSILWARIGKDTLAVGNITGALVFQSCFPVAFGIAFTSWQLSEGTTLSSMIALFFALIYWLLIRAGKLKSWHLMFGAGAYAITVSYLIAKHSGH
jgi:cation:H+ antiporter